MVYKRLEGRNGEIWERYTVGGWSQEALAAEYGLTQQRISEIIADVRGRIPLIDKAEYLRKNLETIEYVRRLALELSQKKAAPVTAGKDGDIVLDPETGEVVRDYAIQFKASELLLKAATDEAKRLGLDAPTKTEISGTVRYEIAGIEDQGDLT